MQITMELGIQSLWKANEQRLNHSRINRHFLGTIARNHWVCVCVCVLLMFIDVYGCLWMFMDVYGCLWLFIDVYWNLLMFIDVYRSLLMSIVYIHVNIYIYIYSWINHCHVVKAVCKTWWNWAFKMFKRPMNNNWIIHGSVDW